MVRVRDILWIPEARRKVVWTFALICVFRAGFFVPVPGVDPAAFREAHADSPVLDWLVPASAFAAGDASSPVLFALGILPYLAATLLFSLAALAVPGLRALFRSGVEGRRRIERYLLIGTLAVAVLLASLLVSAWSPGGAGSGLAFPAPWISALQVLTLTAGSLFLVWIRNRIAALGIGDGTAFLVGAGILARAPEVLALLRERVLHSDPDHGLAEAGKAIAVLALSVAVVAGFVFMARSVRRIPVQQKDVSWRSSGRHYMPLTPRASGALPIIIAQALVTPASGLLGTHPLAGLVSWICIAFLILCLCRLWTRFAVQPVPIADQMKSYGTFIPGVEPGRATAAHLDSIIERLALTEALFLILLALLPVPALEAIDVPPVFVYWPAAMVIVAWGILDLLDAIELATIIRFEEPPGQGQPSRLLPAPRGPSMRARAEPDPGLEGI